MQSDMKIPGLKTIWFNFHYFDFHTAIRFPVLISRHVRFIKKRGSVTINAPVRFGMIRIGFGEVGIFDKARSRTLWEVSGKIIFRGAARIGHGSKISVGPEGTFDIGAEVGVTAESSFVVHKHVRIGDDNLFSWEILVMDTDFHQIAEAGGRVINPPEEIILGNHVWVGCRCLILKGSRVPDGSVLAAGSTVAGKLAPENALFAGAPARMIKEKIEWKT